MVPRKRIQQAATTLPLFGNGTGPTFTPRRGGATSEAASQVLSVYWSAVLHAHALGAAATTAVYPSERQALESLLAVELQRKELARTLLRDIWGLKFLGSSTAEPPRAA